MFDELKEKLPLLIIGMKNIEIKIENKKIKDKIFWNKLKIKIPPLKSYEKFITCFFK